MHVRRAATTAALLAAIAAPAAAEAAPPVTLSTAPVPVKGYAMQVIASKGTPVNGRPVSLTVMFRKGSGATSQSHMYSFGLPAAALVVRPDLRRATLRANLGKYGRLNLVFSGLGRSRRAAPPAGCTGPASLTATGRFAGTMRFVADRTYFRTVTRAPRTGSAGRQVRAGTLQCGGTSTPTNTCTQRSGALMASASSFAPTGSVSFSASQPTAGGPVTQNVFVSESGASIAPASSIFHLISVRAGAPSLAAAADLTSAQIVGGAPYLRGSLAFTVQGEPTQNTTSCPGRTTTTGFYETAGDLTALFDSIGPRQIAGATVSGSLIRY